MVGFRYNDGAELLPQLVPGQTLQLVRESHNRHDAKAIAVRHARGKLDYIPRVDNTVPANLLDQNRKLNAILTPGTTPPPAGTRSKLLFGWRGEEVSDE